jgi:hypothetical protein
MADQTKSSPSWMLSQSHEALCTNITGRDLSVRGLVLPAWVKTAVSMGELPVHHYGPTSHPMSCKHTHTNCYSGSHHHPLWQTGCDLRWCTQPCATAQHPWWADFVQSTTQSTWAGKRGRPVSTQSRWHWWWGHIPITNTSNLYYKLEHTIKLGMICGWNCKVLQFVMWKWHKNLWYLLAQSVTKAVVPLVWLWDLCLPQGGCFGLVWHLHTPLHARLDTNSNKTKLID